MDFRAIVVGGGHAGIEAAMAVSRLGFSTLLITQNLDHIGKLSCNPAVGGLSKGNIVREIDALGGQMGMLIDSAMIQFRILNQSRGPAVQAPRAQADKYLYNQKAKELLEHQNGLSLFQDTVTALIYNGNKDKCEGVITERGKKFTADIVIVTTGTFMDGRIFIGEYRQSSGRLGEPAAIGLGTHLRNAGYSVGRLKTGTPARVRLSSLDLDKMEEQPGDPEMQPFSFWNEKIDRPQVSCYITYTNEKTHKIINENIGRSPLYSGDIVGTGPRYCPSIEDKVVRFPDRNRHQIFIEPEGLTTEEIYLNGISSSLPEDVQEDFLRTIDGLDNVEVMRPGYAVEYDYIDPMQLFPTLESKLHKGLYFAGQTNGTSGYEEAGCQGLIAGINGALALQGKKPLILDRSEAYIGVLIDDLVTLGTKEPYRMFTSRAEYRLSLRHDAADIRLFDKATHAQLLPIDAQEILANKSNALDEIKELLKQRKASKKDRSVDFLKDRHFGKSFYQIMKEPELNGDMLFSLDSSFEKFPKKWLNHAMLDIKYEGYIKRQEVEIQRFKKMENIAIPSDWNWDNIDALSNETKDKFKKIKPCSVGQASRISGVRSSDIAILMVLLERK